MNIEIMPTPPIVYIPLAQHAGEPAVPAVKVGDEVVKGQLIGAAAPKNSCNVFSSCCGKIKAIENRVLPNGMCQHIVIENNGKKDNAHLPPLKDPTPAEIIKRVADCGIVGMGGAGFPTAPKIGAKAVIEELLVNGAECEPYITCDYRIMKEYTEKLLGGILLVQKAADAKRVLIGIEDNKPDAVAAINAFIAQNKLENIAAVAIKTKYPQGSDRQLIYALTGKKIPKGSRSTSYGVLVTNVHTAFSVYLAVNEGVQSYARVITVTGGSVKQPKNLLVSTGTTFRDAVHFCGGINEENPPQKLVSGGPMMGTAVYTGDIAVTKTTSCILLMGAGEVDYHKESACINCGKCARVCPMNLMPMNLDAYSQAGMYHEAEKWGLKYCIECGSCAFICPAKRCLVQSILLAKSKTKGRKE